MSLADDYGLAVDIASIADRKWSKRTWSAVADALTQRLDRRDAAVGSDFTARYRRERLSDRVVSALDAAVLQEQPGTASKLHAILTDIARRRRQWPLVAAYEAERFFERPDVSRLEGLLAAAKKAGSEAGVRQAALRFLETGKRPARSAGWPLPPTNLPCPDRNDGGRGPTKHWDVLRDLAIREGRPDDVLRWHDRLASRGRNGFWRSDDAEVRVARAVAATHPERAIELYRAAAERLIERAKPSAYAEAGGLLRRVRETLDAAGRSSEWPDILAEVRESHRRRPRLMEVLDGLEGKPIVRRKRSRS